MLLQETTVVSFEYCVTRQSSVFPEPNSSETSSTETPPQRVSLRTPDLTEDTYAEGELMINAVFSFRGEAAAGETRVSSS